MSPPGPRQDGDESTTPLDVWLSVRPPERGECRCVDREARSVRQSASATPGGPYSCKLFVDSGKDTETTFTRTEVTEPCPRVVLDDCDCIPSLEMIRGGCLVFSVTIPERPVLSTIVDRLRETGATVSVEQIREHDDADHLSPILTDKQREAFETAVNAGYYDRPRGASLDDLAEVLGISRSAVSQRLCGARNRLAKQYVHRVIEEGESD